MGDAAEDSRSAKVSQDFGVLKVAGEWVLFYPGFGRLVDSARMRDYVERTWADPKGHEHSDAANFAIIVSSIRERQKSNDGR